MSLTTFTIYGERCTGTNFVRKLIFDNFYVEHVYIPDRVHGWKHFFGHDKNVEAIRNSTNCIIFCIVRNPIDYLVSFFNNPHHQAKERKKDFITFISSEFYSAVEEFEEHSAMDIYFEKNRNYKNIFEMRSVKNKFLFLTVPKLTRNSYFMHYEDLKLYPLQFIEEVESRFEIKRKSNVYLVEKKRINPQNEEWNRFSLSEERLKENYVIEDPQAKKIIRERLDFEAETLIGYNKEDILRRLE